MLDRKDIIYCGACGMPPEYCSYGPDYESHCVPWLVKTHPEFHAYLKKLRKQADGGGDDDDEVEVVKPSEPWSMEERLTQFYKKYQPEKINDVPKMLEKYAGNEAKLFAALAKKYGPEPEDPYYADSDSDDDDLEDGVASMSIGDKKKRRGAAAKQVTASDTRVIIQVAKRTKRKAVTTVIGMDTVPGLKLKEASKAFSKRFAGSSSVKDAPGGKKEIIIQGDHMDAVAQMVVDKFKVAGDCVFMDIDGEFVPYK